MIDEKLLSAVIESKVDFIFQGCDNISAHSLRERLLPLRWQVQSEKLNEYFTGLNAVIDAWELQGNPREELWELDYNIIFHRDGAFAALAWLEQIVFSDRYNAWMAFVLVKGHLDNGGISTAKSLINRLVFWKMAPDLRVLMILVHMYDGEFDEARGLVGLYGGADDVGMLRTSLKLAKIMGDYRLALRSADGLELRKAEPNEYIQHTKNQLNSYISMSNWHEEGAENDNAIDAVYVITLNANGQRLRRLRKNFALFNVTFNVAPGLDGRLLPKSFIDRLTGPVAKDREKLVGAFASHYAVWTKIAEGSEHSAFVFEDDALIHIDPKVIAVQLKKNEKIEFAFCGERMEGRLASPVAAPQIFALPQDMQARVRKGIIGADMYWLTKRMAKKLLELASVTGPSHHLDPWLVNVAAKEFSGQFCFVSPSVGGEYAVF